MVSGSLPGSDPFQRRRHDPAIRRGSGRTTSVAFWEKYVGDLNVTAALPSAWPPARRACVTLCCLLSATEQLTCPILSTSAVIALVGGGVSGSHATRHSHASGGPLDAG